MRVLGDDCWQDYVKSGVRWSLVQHGLNPRNGRGRAPKRRLPGSMNRSRSLRHT
jgi:hypothetical protein